MARTPHYEGFEAGPVTVERFGRFIRTRVDWTPEEHEAYRRELAKLQQEMPRKIKEKAVRLEALIGQLDPFDVIANASLASSIIDADNYVEWKFEGSQAHSEYITLLCLKRPRWTSAHRFVRGNEHGPIHDLVREIFEDTKLLLMSGHVDARSPASPPTILDELRYLSRMEELVVRFPGYEHHLKELLIAAFVPVDEWLVTNLGFSIADAIELTDGLHQLREFRLAQRGKEARDSLKVLRREVRDYQRGRLNKASFPMEAIEQLAGLREKDMLRQTKVLCMDWLFFGLGDTLACTAEELGAFTKLETARAQSFLETFSVSFGSTPVDLYVPQPVHALRTHPIVRDDSRFLCTSSGNLLWSLRPRLEQSMNPDLSGTASRKVWAQYVRSRATWLEDEALRLIQMAAPRAKTSAKLSYAFPDKPDKHFEVDGIVQLDRVLIIMEAKAGTLKEAARRGAPASLESSLRDLVADAHSQALRAKAYIDAVEQPTFVCEDGSRVQLDKEAFDETILMTVSLDSLLNFPPIMHRIARLDIFSKGTLPWTVPILDLRVIAEIVEFPSQLIHFIRRRLRISELAIIRAHDELDYFGHYLQEGLYFESLGQQQATEVNLLSYTDRFDAYYLTELGYRSKPASKPRQEIPRELRKVIDELEKLGPDGYIDVVCRLLDWDQQTRRLIGRQLVRNARNALKDGRLHDFTLQFENERSGLTLMTSPKRRLEELKKKLEGYCVLKKYQQRYESWLGIGFLATRPTTPVMFLQHRGVWEYDESLEAAVAKMLAAAPRQVRMG